MSVFLQNEGLVQQLLSPHAGDSTVNYSASTFYSSQRAIRRRTVVGLRGCAEPKVNSPASSSPKSVGGYLLGSAEPALGRNRSPLIKSGSDRKLKQSPRTRSISANARPVQLSREAALEHDRDDSTLGESQCEVKERNEPTPYPEEIRESDTEEDLLNALVGKHRELDIADLEWDEERGVIASGMFGNVYKGKWRGVDCAIKELKCVPHKGTWIS